MSAADPASIRSLGLSRRTIHMLERASIRKVDQLAALSRAQLDEIPGIGSGSITEIVTCLAARRAQSGLPEVLPTAPPPPVETPAARAPRPPRRERHAESQKRLLARALESFGRPTHVTDIVQRAMELSPQATVPNSGRSLLLLLNTNELITLGEGVFSLVAWESARANETRPVLPICPRPWVDLDAFQVHFFESVFTGREQLADEPAASEFVARMLAWWGVDTGARLWVQQSVVTAYYLVGLAPYAFVDNADAHLRCDLPSLSIPDTRRHCLRTLTARLAAMPQFWTVMWVKGAARPKELAEAFAPLHPYGLNDVEQRLYFLTALGAAERLSSGQYRLTPLGKQCAAEWGQGDAARQLRPAGAIDRAERAPAASSLPGPVVSAPIAPRAEPVAGPADKLFYCPNLWPDELTDEQAFFAFVDHARHILARQPDTGQFLTEMLTWAGRKPDQTKRYYQSVLDVCYIVGLIDRVSYGEHDNRPLGLRLPAQKDEQTLREYCVRSALARLEIGPRLLREAVETQVFTCEQVQAKLMTADDNIDSHLRLFRNLGLLSLYGQIYSSTLLAEVVLERISDQTQIQSLEPKAGGEEEAEKERNETEAPITNNDNKIRRCPALLPDRIGETQTFMESILYANKFLTRRPTTEEFLKEMILWAGREYPKSKDYYQNILDAYYVVGLIDRTPYVRNKNSVLLSLIKLNENLQTIRDICIRSALARLEFGWLLLEKAKQLEPFTTRDIQSALDTYYHDASYHIRLFISLGLFAQDGVMYRLTPIAAKYQNDVPVSYKIELPNQTLAETKQSWDYEDGLEALAYLSID